MSRRGGYQAVPGPRPFATEMRAPVGEAVAKHRNKVVLLGLVALVGFVLSMIFLPLLLLELPLLFWLIIELIRHLVMRLRA